MFFFSTFVNNGLSNDACSLSIVNALMVDCQLGLTMGCIVKDRHKESSLHGNYKNSFGDL